MANFHDLIAGLGAEASRLSLWGILGIFLLAGLYLFLKGRRSKLMMSRRRRRLLLVLRLIILLLLAGALAQITMTRKVKALSVAFLVDASQSIPAEEMDRARQLLTEAWTIKGDTPVRVLSFDRVTRESPNADGAPEIKRLSDQPGTDIARSIHAAQELFTPNTYHRAVLLSDGNETRGDALFAAKQAAERGVHVDVIPLQTLTDRDIYIESINLPQRARPGERIKVSVTVMSNFATPATLNLMRGKTVEQKKTFDVAPGANTVDFDTTVQGQYSPTFTASISADGDDHVENNALSAMLRVVGNPRIMVFSGTAEKDLAMIDALTASKLSVSAAPIDRFPSSMAGLNPYDLVVLSNIDFLQFGKEKAKILESFVGEYGGGLLVVGGENSSKLRPDSEKDKKTRKKLPIEQVLPVLLQEKKKTEPNPVALMLVIDKSASMSRENKFGMAIRAAKDSIGILNERSQVGVILFDDFPRIAIPLQSAKNKEQIIEELDRFGVDGGTSIYPALKETYAILKPQPNKVRHVILLSDGHSISMYDQNAHLLQYMADKKITISTVALGKESDKEHLRRIAHDGRGRFYYTEDIDQIPKIFMEETKSITKTNVVETEFEPKLVNRGQMLLGIDVKAMPRLYGYNAAKPKPTSQVYLNAEKEETLLARWRYGLGKVTFVGTDSSGPWSRKWPDWRQFAQFWSQVARNTLGDQNRRSYRLDARLVEDRAEVTVDALDRNGSFLNDLDLTLEVTSPDGQTFPVPLTQSRPGGYKGAFDTGSFGEYSFQVSDQGIKAAEGAGIGRVFLSPPTEFIRQQPNTPLLETIAEITQGRYNPSIEQIFQMPEQTFPVTRQVWPYLLYAALGLFLVTIFIRRG